MTRSDALTPAEWELWDQWMRAQRLLAQEIERRLQNRFGISKAEFSVLVTLARLPDRGSRAVDISNVLGWEKSRLSHQLARMEKRGFVARKETGSSGRRTGIVLTSAGRSLAEDAIAWHAGNVRECLYDLAAPNQLAAIRAWSEGIIKRFDDHGRSAADA